MSFKLDSTEPFFGKIPDFSIMCYLEIIQDCIGEILILNKKPYVHVRLDKYKYRTLKDRVQKPPPFVLDVTSFKEGSYKDEMERIYKITNFLCTLLNQLYLDIDDNRDYTLVTMSQIVNDIKKMKNDEDLLFHSDEAEYYQVLNTQLKMMDTKVDKLNKERFLFNEDLNEKLQNNNNLSTIKKRYLENWEKSCQKQHLIYCNMKIDNYNNEIQYYKNKMNDELSTHLAITTYLWLNISELRDSIEEQEEKYEKDYAEMTRKLNIEKDKRIDINEQIEKLQIEYNQREKAMKEVLILREQWRKDKELEEKEELVKKQSLENQQLRESKIQKTKIQKTKKQKSKNVRRIA